MGSLENEPKPSPVLSSRPGLVLSGTAKLFAMWAEQALAPLKLKNRHLVVMQIISEAKCSCQTNVCAHLRMDRTTMVKTIDDLEKMGLAIRIPIQGDRRAHGLELTPKGREVLASGMKEIGRVEGSFFKSLSKTELNTLNALLVRLLRHPANHPEVVNKPQRKRS